jgi:hypothetical protein
LWPSGSGQIEPQSIDLDSRASRNRAFYDRTDLSAATYDDPTLSQDIPITLNDFRYPGAIRTDLVSSLAQCPLPAWRRHTIRGNEFHLAEAPLPIEVGHNKAPEQHCARASRNLPIERAPVTSPKGAVRTGAPVRLGLDT